MTDALGTRPDPGRPRWSYWYLIVFGAYLASLPAWPGAGFGNPYAPPLAAAAGLSLASSGTAGLLLRAGRGGPSLWFSVLQALLLFPLVALGSLLSLSWWVGPLWAAGGSALLLGAWWLLASRSRRPGRGPADRAAGPEDGR